MSNRNGAGRLLDSMIAERVVVAFETGAAALQSRLPRPWQVTRAAGGANLVALFHEVLLNQDGAGRPARDAVGRYMGLVIPARHPQSGETASMNFRIYAANPEALPGKYRTAAPATIHREQRMTGDGLSAIVHEAYTVAPSAREEIVMRIGYRRDIPAHVPTRSRGRSAADPEILRVYDTDQLVETVLDPARDVDRLVDFEFRAEVAELRDLFDGGQRLANITVSPWYYRRVYDQ